VGAGSVAERTACEVVVKCEVAPRRRTSSVSAGTCVCVEVQTKRLGPDRVLCLGSTPAARGPRSAEGEERVEGSGAEWDQLDRGAPANRFDESAVRPASERGAGSVGARHALRGKSGRRTRSSRREAARVARRRSGCSGFRGAPCHDEGTVADRGEGDRIEERRLPHGQQNVTSKRDAGRRCTRSTPRAGARAWRGEIEEGRGSGMAGSNLCARARGEAR